MIKNEKPIHESGEDYLETILLLHKKTGFVRSIDIANELNFSKPSVSRAMGILKDNELISILESGQILLTQKGKTKAKEIYSRHVFLKEFLMSVGVKDKTAEEDACKIEHVISKETFKKLKDKFAKK